MRTALQQLLAGMPERQPELAVRAGGDGQLVVLGDRKVVLFGPFDSSDLGARNIGVVTLTHQGFPVKDVAAAFGLKPGTVSQLRTEFHRGGAAALVAKSGRPAVLTEDRLAEAAALARSGQTQQRLADKYGVTQSAIAHGLRRHAARVGASAHTQPALDETKAAAEAEDAQACQADTAGGPPEPSPAPGRAPRPQPQAAPAQPAPAGEPWSARRVESGERACRYAGAMLAHAYLDRVGAGQILGGLAGAAARRFDQGQVAVLTVLALMLGAGSVEQAKTLIRSHAGPLVGADASPELSTLRSRLAATADAADVPGLQRRLAAATLQVAGASAGVYYVDDHFVPYSGAKPVAKGHNGKRDRREKGRADTLVTDARGRAVCFVTAEPSHLAKTMRPALAELRAIVPDGPILLGFDRGGAYAEAFNACRDHGIDFITYRRGKLADTAAAPARHTIRRGRQTATVVLADEQIRFSDAYTGPCRQLTLYEHHPECDCGQPDQCDRLAPVLQVLTSDLDASAPALLLALKGRWATDNANVFKCLGFYGIDWLVDYHAEITANTKQVDNPARKQANAAIRAGKRAIAEAERALGALIEADLTVTEKNQRIPAAQQDIADRRADLARLSAERDAIPVRLPANQVNPDAQRALLRAHRRGLLMSLRLLAYNAETWLADRLNTHLRDPNEYRAITRSLMHQPGVIAYTPHTPHTITVTLEPHHTPRVNRALKALIDELNTTPPRIPGDSRPITYRIAS
jgi:transposase